MAAGYAHLYSGADGGTRFESLAAATGGMYYSDEAAGLPRVTPAAAQDSALAPIPGWFAGGASAGWGCDGGGGIGGVSGVPVFVSSSGGACEVVSPFAEAVQQAPLAMQDLRFGCAVCRCNNVPPTHDEHAQHSACIQNGVTCFCAMLCSTHHMQPISGFR